MIPLINIEQIIINEKYKVSILYIKRIIGAIFCHVNNSNEFIQFNPSITSGNQKWKGAAPILVNKAELKIIEYILGMRLNIKLFDIKIIANNKIVEAKACVIKYLIEASEEFILLLLFIRGIIDSKLISKPIHIPNHEYEEIEIIVLIINVVKKINL